MLEYYVIFLFAAFLKSSRNRNWMLQKVRKENVIAKHNGVEAWKQVK